MGNLILTFDIDGLRGFNNYKTLDKDIFLERGIPEILSFLDKANVNATFFLVGQNILDFPALHKQLKKFEVGNHTYSHPQNFTKHSLKQEEIKKAHNIIKKNLGRSPRLFRAPDYQIDGEIIRILKENKYKYDSSLIKVLFPFKYHKIYKKQKKLLNDKFEIPLTSFILPFNGTSIISYGEFLSKKIFNYLSKRNVNMVLNFHARDFVNYHSKSFNLYYKNRKKALKVTLSFLHYAIAHSNKVSCIGDFYE